MLPAGGDLCEQAGVLHGDGRLGGQGLGQVGVLSREEARLGLVHREQPDRLIGHDQRHR